MSFKVILITGGARSGKSRYALQLAQKYGRKVFIATATGCDDEMAARIAKHRKDRDSSFATIEEPVMLGNAINCLPSNTNVAVIDCLTVWLGNLMHNAGTQKDLPEIDNFIASLRQPPCDIVVVTNEVGMGIVPDNELAREFRDVAGSLNRRVAEIASQVIFMVSGLPINLKDANSETGGIIMGNTENPKFS
ncbi:MAG: bifunctional adenosylcobinamide kinase/adenosylcobinamide-phosphate guanylyltransferase [Lentisphaerae bacterium]|nr:bifunctional adenosylcobinamide kinase/adenosylcobinamide-phosphate guanylyltransferase [Lentisphaerota bacterium]